MILRCTAKMLALLGVRISALASVAPSDDDWYLNLVWIERRKCLLLTHAETLFPVFVADILKADLGPPLGPYVVSHIEEQLRSENLATDVLGRLDPDDVHVATTASRSVLGVMNDAARHARYRIEDMGGIDRSDASYVNHFLRRTFHRHPGGYVTPLELVSRRS